jgi:biotin carboxylase
MTRGKRVLLVAATTGYQTRAFADAGARLGYEMQLATDHCPRLGDPWGDHAIPVKFHHPEAGAEAIAAAVAASGPFDGIVAVGDQPAYLAALAARRLGLPCSAPEAVLACRNKYLARERFQAAGLNVPAYYRIPTQEDPAGAAAGARYPCVLKPLGLSGSRGVIRADNPRQFAEAFHRIKDILASPDILRRHEDQDRFIQVEEYIDGSEFALEGLLSHGRFETIALFDKPDPLTGPFFEETLYVTPSRSPLSVQAAIVETARRATAALGLTHGPVHAEMRVNQSGVWMLEVAARPIGGLCAQALRFESGLSLEEVVLQHAAGDPIRTLRLSPPARGVMMIPIPEAGVYSGLEGLDAALGTPCVENVVITAKEGQALIPLPEGASYLGFIFAAGDTPEQVERALRNAHARLRFTILEALPVIR